MRNLNLAAMARLDKDLARVDLGDPRRGARARQIMQRMARKPNKSLPEALGTEREVEGGYRFFGTDEFGFVELFGGHRDGTSDRAAGKEVMAIHDTTGCHYRNADPKEVGYLQTGKPGFYLHMTLLLDNEDWRRPLGIIHAEPYKREKKSKRGRKKKVSGAETAKWKNKESDRWLRGVLETEKQLAGKATGVIHLADRESDQYPLLSEMVESNLRFVLRNRHNRVIEVEGEKLRLRALVAAAVPQLTREVPLSRRLAKSAPVARRSHPARQSRVAKLQVSSTTAELKRPRYVDGRPDFATVNVVHVSEVDAPAGQDPVDWLLYTSEPIDTAEQVAAVVDYYRSRWVIEELNKALKTGCVVQERQLESYSALLNMLALSLPIAVEILALRCLANSSPDRPASDLFSSGQLAALRHLSDRPVPKRPTVKDALWAIAGIGGHMKNNGDPGWQVLQRGMDEFLAFAQGWCARESKTSDQS
jgi:hypothetical protein